MRKNSSKTGQRKKTGNYGVALELQKNTKNVHQREQGAKANLRERKQMAELHEIRKGI